jgi:hypothetical protein
MGIDDLVLFSLYLENEVYGPRDGGPDLGLLVEYQGGVMQNVHTREIFLGPSVIGTIVAYDYTNGSAIIAIDDGFLGWIAPHRYRVLNLVTPTTQTLH